MTWGWKKFDWSLFGAFCVLAAASLVSLASSNQTFFIRQSIWVALALCIIFFGSRIDWRWFGSQQWFRYGLYLISVALLIISNIQPETIRGTRSWIVIGNFQFEPAELSKLALIFIFAYFLSRHHVALWRGKNIFITLAYTVPLIALIAMHPDFGSAFVIGVLWFGYMLISGIHKKRFIIGMFGICIIAVLAWSFLLKPYQQDRILGFLRPSSDPLGLNYNVIQSKIAIGSAGFFGKGFGAGTQTQLHFLPEAQADFLFAAFVEEWGLFGGILVIVTFLFLFYRLVEIGLRARDNQSRLIIFGAGLLFATHFFVNIGSNVGLVPVAGIPFPFFSYGGSHLLTGAILLSIIEHIKLESSE